MWVVLQLYCDRALAAAAGRRAYCAGTGAGQVSGADVVAGAGLIDKLNQIITKLNNGQTAQACLQLTAFINQVNGLISDKTLSPAIGQSLITAANNIKANVGC